MTTKAKAKPEPVAEWQRLLVRYLPGWIMIAMVSSILLPNLLSAGFGATGSAITRLLGGPVNTAPLVESIVSGVESPVTTMNTSTLAPLFTDEIDYWSELITRWAAYQGIDPNLLATVMQIESCGNSTVSSYAGAQGLFQVMPFHFSTGEVYTDPETNALRGSNFLNECLGYSSGDAGLALACYNGGPSLVSRQWDYWPNESQRYYTWGTGIYEDARQNLSESDTLTQWLDAGGQYLCNDASISQGRPITTQE